MIYKRDCEFFRGDVPCKPHKTEEVHCDDCKYYVSKPNIILIIKLGAIGDVIRTTPLIQKLKKEHPDSLIWWLTYSPEVIPSSVNGIFTYTPESIVTFQATHFKKLINLDKDRQACALTKILNADEKFGYTLIDGKPAPIDEKAVPKFLTGLFDDVNQANTKSYTEEIFEICGYKFAGEEYEIDFDDKWSWDIPNNGKPIIGLNTGCGSRWVSRLWKEEYWAELIVKLQKAGYFPLLLGGEQEHERNSSLAQNTGAMYLGYFPMKQFFSLVNKCDTVVTAVTMGMHIAIALKKKLVLMNNIFNPAEFDMYGRGIIVQPQKKCTCFFSPTCKNEEYFCLDSLTPEMMFEAVEKLK